MSLSSALSTSTVFILRPDVVVTLLDEGAVLLDLDTKFFYSANGGAWGIVQLFEAGATIDQVQAQCRAWGADEGAMEAVERVIATLLADALLSEATTPAETTVPGCQWSVPQLEKHKEPLQKIMVSAFDPSIPLAE